MKLESLYVTVCLCLVSLGGKTEIRPQKGTEKTDIPAGSMVLTLERTVDMARKNSPSAVAARHTFRSAYWNYRSFRANYLPSLILSSNPDLTRTINKITLPDGSEKYVSQNMLTLDGALTVQQNIPFTGGSFYVESALQRMRLFDSATTSFRTFPIVVGYNQSLFGYNSLKWDRKIEPLRFRQAKKSYIEALELVSAEAVDRFFALVQAQSNYEMACFNYANADTLYRFARGRYEIGTITENELLQLEINKLTESTNKMDALIEMDDCRQALSTFLGLSKEIFLTVKSEMEVPCFKIDPRKAFELFNQNSPDMESLKIRLFQSRSEVAQARSNAGLKADLYLECGLSQTGGSFQQAYRRPLDQQQVRLGVSLPVLDWGRGKGKIKVAESREELVKIQVEQDRNNLEMNIRKLVLQFNLQSERVAIALKTDSTAPRRNEVARKLYLLGKSSILDLNAAVSEKDTASRNFLNALHTYWRLYYMLRSMTLYDFKQDQEITENYEQLEN